MHRLLWLALVGASLALTACGPADTPQVTQEAPPATLEERIAKIEAQPNLSAEQKEAAIAILKQQEANKTPGAPAPAP